MKPLIFLLGMVVFLGGCLPYHPMRGQLDSCNFHIGQYGTPLRWTQLPVYVVLNENAMNQQSKDSTLKVVEEWNHVWGQETGGQLFSVLGQAGYPSVKDVLNDGYNSVSLVDSRSNEELSVISSSKTSSKFFTSSTQGVTRTVARRFFVEGDILLNDDDYDFYYEESKMALNNSKEERHLASTTSPSNFFGNFLDKLKSLLFFWKELTPREPTSKRIPSHLIDFESLISHEMGHLLGLGHLEVSGSIMKSKMRPGTTRRGLNQIELNSLKCGYLDR